MCSRELNREIGGRLWPRTRCRAFSAVLSARRAGVCAGVDGFGSWSGHLAEILARQPKPGGPSTRGLLCPRPLVQSLPGPARLHPADPGGQAAGDFHLGGGVPRNWAQQVGPFVDTINVRLGPSCPRRASIMPCGSAPNRSIGAA